MLVSVQVSICPQSKWIKGAESSHSAMRSVWSLLWLASPGACACLLCLMGSPVLLWFKSLIQICSRSPPAQPAEKNWTSAPLPRALSRPGLLSPRLLSLLVSALPLLSHPASFPSSSIFLTSLVKCFSVPLALMRL